MTLNNKTKGNLILLFTAFIWGFAFAFQSQGGSSLGPYTFGAARITCALIAVLSVNLLQKKTQKKKDEKDRFIPAGKSTLRGGVLCGIFMGIAINLQQIGINLTSAGKAGFISALYILLVPIIAAVIFRSKVPSRAWIAVALAVVGMYLLCMKPGESFSLGKGEIVLIICALFFSLQILLADRFLPWSDPVKFSAIQFAVIAVMSWILAFVFEAPGLRAMKGSLIPILYCGFISGGAGYTLQLVGQKYTDPTSASLCMSLESVFAVLGGALILSERMSVRELLGCLIMFMAIIFVQLPSRHDVK